ncbi:MAG: T9SS type A sorting domain-containing protein [Candidatus Cloacimonetes bacterium]|nr:T9SS type A sorting domain-containing protein [Candidatus Cloacimonadota bacterium]
MKKLLFLSVLLCALVLYAQDYPDSGYVLRLDGFYLEPVAVGPHTEYEYMLGAYDGFPIRMQPDTIFQQGIYMTYMNQATAGQARRQRAAFSDLNGNILSENEVTLGTQEIGFGTLALDNTTGNPFFTWHVNSNPRLVDMVFDAYCYNYDPLGALSEPMRVTSNERPANRPTHPSPSATVRAEEFSFIWPVIFTGPSPIANHQRLYVFLSNTGSGWAEASGNANGYMPSSARRLAFADVYFDGDEDYTYIYNPVSTDVYWSIKVIDYFERIHYWDGMGTDGATSGSRVYASYAVSPDGKVALAGSIIGPDDTDWIWEKYDLSTLSSTSAPSSYADYPNDGEWPGRPGEPYDHVIVSNNNYGEGDYYVKRINYEKHWPAGQIWTFVDPSGDSHTLNAPNGNDLDACDFRMDISTMNNKTLTYDSRGKLYLPTVYGVNFSHWAGSVPPPYNPQDRYTWIGAEINYLIVYDNSDHTTRLDRVYPFPMNNVGEVSLPFDINNDGVIDEEITEFNAAGQLTTFYRGSLAFYHWERANRFHTSQMRMSNSHDGLMTMMWIDSYKSFRYNNPNGSDPEYQPWEDTGEILVTLSTDDGDTWSRPLMLSKVTNIELANMRPSFIYPADRVIQRRSEGGRATIYFMFVDDDIYGNMNVDPPIGGPGAQVKLAAINVSYGVDGTDITLPNAKSILSPNYPNPFNPSTSIEFDISKAGNVNLSVYNIKGQLVRTLTNDHYTVGTHKVQWHGVDDNNNPVASGVYFYKIVTQGNQEIRRMALIK